MPYSLRHRSFHERRRVDEERQLRELRLQLVMEERALGKISAPDGAPFDLSNVARAREAVEGAILDVREGRNRPALYKLRFAVQVLSFSRYSAIEDTREQIEATLNRWEPERAEPISRLNARPVAEPYA